MADLGGLTEEEIIDLLESKLHI